MKNGKTNGIGMGEAIPQTVPNGTFDVDAEIQALEVRLRKLRRLNRLRRIVRAAEISQQAVADDAGLQPILDVVCARVCVEASDILGRRRTARIAWPRHITAYLLSEFTSGSSSHIGEILGGRDHGTILNSLNAVENRMETERQFAGLMHEMLGDVQAVVAAMQPLTK